MELEERKKNFYEKVGTLYSTYYPKPMLLEFCEYWTEHNEGGKKMRFEMQKVFDLNRRLKTWHKNTIKFNYGKQTISDTGLFTELQKDITIPDYGSSTGG